MTWLALATYRAADADRVAIVTAEAAFDLAGCLPSRAGIVLPATLDGIIRDWPRCAGPLSDIATSLAREARVEPLAAPVLRLPFRPERIFATASNYVEHADEMGTALAAKADSRPYMFMKADSSAIGPNDDIRLPSSVEQLDWEVELAAVIGMPARHVAATDALAYVAGYTILNDISARDLSKRSDYPFKFDWFRGKSFDTFAPIGPWFVPRSCVPDPQCLAMRLRVNGELMQDGNSADMIFTLAEQIAYLSSIVTLRPGDVIATGTPTGVGMGRGVFLAAGDEVAAWIEGIGDLRNRVVPENVTTAAPGAGERRARSA